MNYMFNFSYGNQFCRYSNNCIHIIYKCADLIHVMVGSYDATILATLGNYSSLIVYLTDQLDSTISLSVTSSISNLLGLLVQCWTLRWEFKSLTLSTFSFDSTLAILMNIFKYGNFFFFFEKGPPARGTGLYLN